MQVFKLKVVVERTGMLPKNRNIVRDFGLIDTVIDGAFGVSWFLKCIISSDRVFVGTVNANPYVEHFEWQYFDARNLSLRARKEKARSALMSLPSECLDNAPHIGSLKAMLRKADYFLESEFARIATLSSRR